MLHHLLIVLSRGLLASPHLHLQSRHQHHLQIKRRALQITAPVPTHMLRRHGTLRLLRQPEHPSRPLQQCPLLHSIQPLLLPTSRLPNISRQASRVQELNHKLVSRLAPGLRHLYRPNLRTSLLLLFIAHCNRVLRARRDKVCRIAAPWLPSHSATHNQRMQ